MAISLDLQNEQALEVPAAGDFSVWIEAALLQTFQNLEQTIRVVDESESRDLNHRYRGKDHATNVLAFPAQTEYLDYDCLGDLVICAPVVAAEAQAQGKDPRAHWAHLVVHGMLHLQGYDHQTDAETAVMEQLEIKILDTLGYTNPYND